MPESGIFMFCCGRPTWSCHAGLSITEDRSQNLKKQSRNKMKDATLSPALPNFNFALAPIPPGLHQVLSRNGSNSDSRKKRIAEQSHPPPMHPRNNAENTAQKTIPRKMSVITPRKHPSAGLPRYFGSPQWGQNSALLDSSFPQTSQGCSSDAFIDNLLFSSYLSL